MDKKEMIKQAMQQAVGITDEDFEKHISNPKNLALSEHTLELMKYKIIAEVTETRYCSAGLKVGQRYTFQVLPAMLLKGFFMHSILLRATKPSSPSAACFEPDPPGGYGLP